MSALKNFVVTFLISALIFGSVAYFATQFLTDTITGIFDAEKSELDSILNPSNPADTASPENQPDQGGDPSTERVIEGSSFNMLFVVTDYQPDIFTDYYPTDEELSNMENENAYFTGLLSTPFRRPRACATLLFRADKERKEFTLTPIPACTRVTTVAGNYEFADLYDLYGRDYVISQVSAMTGLNIDYYMVVNVTELSQIITNMGGIHMYLTSDLYYNGQICTTKKPLPEEEDLIPLLYQIGNNEIDGPGSTALMVHNEIESQADVTARDTLLVNFFTAVMNTLTAMPETDLTSFYDSICANAMADTTLSVPDFISEIGLIYAWNDASFKKTTLDYPGKYIAATDAAPGYFSPNMDSAVSFFKNYRRLPSADPAENTNN